MNLATALFIGQQARAVREPLEYPKWVTVAGKPELALTAEHENELLAPERTRQEEADLQAELERDEAEKTATALAAPKPSDVEPEVDNLLSAPEKRELTPRIIARSKGA